MPRKKKGKAIREPGLVARASEQTLHSYSVGALPIINRLLDRIDLKRKLEDHLRRDGPRMEIPTSSGVLLLVRNCLVSREPIYGVGEWASFFAPDLLGLTRGQVALLNDDRAGRWLDRLFDCDIPHLALAVVRHVIGEFSLSLDEFHNDSTTVSFFGTYEDAAEEGVQRGRPTPAITYGRSKAHRPDLKQLLYTLTVTEDGGVPVYFTTHSGNTVDDQTHQETWDILRSLVGHPRFLYIADCKLASTDNMKYIDRQGGRFITVLPRTRKEDQIFRERLLNDAEKVIWDPVYTIEDEHGEEVDRLSCCGEETLSADKYRLWWFHSTRKARLDHRFRLTCIQRATVELDKLRNRLLGPRPRLRRQAQVEPLVSEILRDTGAEGLLRVEFLEYEGETYHQVTPGRPGKNTKYRRETEPLCDITWESDPQALVERQKMDGVFPLITNVTDMTAEQVLRAYKRQPFVEKRFSQFKSDYRVAPIYLKNVSRIQAILCVYFFVLLVQTLLERELRRAMKRAKLESLPLYPENRACKAPSTRRLLDIFEPIQRHTLTAGDHTERFVSELSKLQRTILKLLGMSADGYGM
jgi:transposase